MDDIYLSTSQRLDSDPVTLARLAAAIAAAGPDGVPAGVLELSMGGELITESVTFIWLDGKRIAALVPAHVGDEHLDDAYGPEDDEGMRPF